MASNGTNPWRVLGIESDSGVDAIRRAYLRLVRIHHPDQFRWDPNRYRQEEEIMKKINAAYREALALAGQAPATRPPRTASAPNPFSASGYFCQAHGRLAVIYCAECATPLCSRCDTRLSGFCSRHRRSGPSDDSWW